MEEEYGQLNIEVVFVKADPEIAKKLFARLRKEKPDSYTDEKQVKALLRYNVWTIDQFCDVSGLSVSTVNNLARPTFSAKENKVCSTLNYCFPHPDSGGKGPKFVVRNEKSEKYIKI